MKQVVENPKTELMKSNFMMSTGRNGEQMQANYGTSWVKLETHLWCSKPHNILFILSMMSNWVSIVFSLCSMYIYVREKCPDL